MLEEFSLSILSLDNATQMRRGDLVVGDFCAKDLITVVLTAVAGNEQLVIKIISRGRPVCVFLDDWVSAATDPLSNIGYSPASCGGFSPFALAFYAGVCNGPAFMVLAIVARFLGVH